MARPGPYSCAHSYTVSGISLATNSPAEPKGEVGGGKPDSGGGEEDAHGGYNDTLAELLQPFDWSNFRQ